MTDPKSETSYQSLESQTQYALLADELAAPDAEFDDNLAALSYIEREISEWTKIERLAAARDLDCADNNKKEIVLENTIEQFLAEVEKKAYRMAEIATQNSSDALDIVQDSMIKLVENYADKPSNEWRPLFYRILQSKMMDYFRKKKRQSMLFFWKKNDCDDEFDPIDSASDHICPEREEIGRQEVILVTEVLKKLPLRQQQCFMLRSWEGLSVKETAEIMGCGEGSVKTHYSRAREFLKTQLSDIVKDI